MNQLSIIEYIWLDGYEPSPGLRSKARILSLGDSPTVDDLPRWSFDGTLTAQADSHDHDCVLSPVRLYADPLRGQGHYLVLCEVLDAGGCTHISNKRAPFRALMDDTYNDLDPWVGFEQPYHFTRKGSTEPTPADDKSAYCSVASRSFDTCSVVEAHARACLEAGLLFYGMNSESTHNNWRFQMGPRGVAGDVCDALKTSDDLWMARFLLARLAEQAGLDVHYHFEQGYAHLHTSFSTRYTRDPRCGLNAIQAVSYLLDNSSQRQPHSYHCQPDIGWHFSAGITQRTAAVRIPPSVVQQGCGYLVDHRPCADADPYELANYLVGLMLADDLDGHLDRTA
ncbi:hypothetical protein BGP77_12410 [Saccharospirillum sp. MSK14-1]|uniref:glutamine synthetase beta-grasp domain-containing protein n=1 Tax=Saccharospirillum sp. MSK14-1 TaxID=1897632 RepID=UPI000D3448B3|nr:glutamine synthetase beta-grasp domain-containing protein [Saccharospirillum sp. MSK14-1]PTY38502.1 hypothetical protein BGP77_12410 [Saccharospirillum sp. MSK14-1]